MNLTHARAARWTTLGALAASLLVIDPVATSAKSEWTPGKYLKEALVRVMGSTRKLTQKTRYGLDDQSTCFIGAYMEVGANVVSRIPLKAGTQYAFLGGGDNDTKDLDLYVEDDDGNVLVKDDAADANPVVVFEPKEDGKYRIKMKLVSSTASGSFACYATLRDGGFDVPVSNLATATSRLLALCGKINDRLGPVYFHDGHGELCLIGSIMSQGQTLTQSGFVLQDRPYAFVGTADNRAEDIDLKVVDGDNDVVASDEEKDSTPIAVLPKGGRTVSLKLSDARSKGASLCLATALKLKKS